MKKMIRFAPVLLLMACVACTQPGISPAMDSDMPASESGGRTASVTEFDSARDAAVASVSEDPATSRAAVSHLRALGADGVAVMKDVHGAEVAYRLGEGPATDADRATSDRVLAAFDAVSAQRDGWASGLF